MSQSPYMTPGEVADELRVTSETVVRWCRRGDLVAVKAGRRWRIHREELERFLKNEQPDSFREDSL